MVANARAHGDDLDVYVRNALQVLRAGHLDSVWITNLPADALVAVATIADEEGMAFYPSVSSVEAKVKGRDLSYYTRTLPPLVQSVADLRNPAGWVVSDEPAPDDFNGPNTERASESYFRSEVRRAASAIWPGKAFWVMAQSFAEIWGPQRYDTRRDLIALPGSYLHWTSPSPAGMR